MLPTLSEVQKKYLDVIDQLRKLGIIDQIVLPQLVVLGEQSAGKSSVLESISQTELPRGTGWSCFNRIHTHTHTHTQCLAPLFVKLNLTLDECTNTRV